jgi:hypothetical protein
MTDTPNIFNNEDENDTINPATPEDLNNNLEDKLNSIVNESGQPKYKDVATALDALQASQQFIEQLKSEKKAEEEAKERAMKELEKVGNIEDFVNRLNPTPEPKTVTPTKVSDSEGLSVEQVDAIFQKKLEEQNRRQQEISNLTSVQKSLAEKFGDQAAAKVKQRAEELGTTPAAMEDMAKNNPKLVLELFGSGVAPTSTSPSQTTTFGKIKTSDDDEPLKVEHGKGPLSGGMSTKEVTELFRKSSKSTNKRLGISE